MSSALGSGASSAPPKAPIPPATAPAAGLARSIGEGGMMALRLQGFIVQIAAAAVAAALFALADC